MCSLTIEIYNYFNLLFQIYWCVEPQWDIKLMHRDRYWFETPINWKWFPLLICDHLKILNMNFYLMIICILLNFKKKKKIFYYFESISFQLYIYILKNLNRYSIYIHALSRYRKVMLLLILCTFRVTECNHA